MPGKDRACPPWPSREAGNDGSILADKPGQRLRYRFGEHKGTLLALVVFVVMFGLYTGNHPAGFTANVVQTAANKGVLLAWWRSDRPSSC